MTLLRRLLREPLVHFLLLGVLLFAWFQWQGGSGGAGSNRIVITRGLAEHLASSFVSTWGRPPTEIELKGLIDDHVMEEIATREGLGMGLDRDDTIIRRRLRQKLEFLLVEEAGSAPPTDKELQAWLDKHPDTFRVDPRVAFRQVYLSPNHRGTSLQADAEKVLAKLRVAGPEAAIDRVGDSTMLPAEQPLEPLREISRTYGEDFAQDLLKIEPGQWIGPVASPFGLHLVLVRERVPGVAPPLAGIRPFVEREVLAERRKADLRSLYDRLLAKYTVEIETQKTAAARRSVLTAAKAAR
ncbi:MAG: peptidylprolyl isomerase [Casimicrobiaceae bacterium]